MGYFIRYGLELIVRRPVTRAARADWTHRFAAAAANAVGLEIEVEGDLPAGGAIISNHLTYMDIVVMAALHPCVFVSKAEVAGYPVLGWMTTMAGTVFVARGQGGSAARARASMDEALQSGIPVTFFPEGTTTNASRLLPFRSGILAQVLEAGASVTAAHLSYTIGPDNGTASVADDVCFWQDDVPLLKHIWGFLALKGVQAHVRVAAQPIDFTPQALQDRKYAASEAWEAVARLAESDTSGHRTL